MESRNQVWTVTENIFFAFFMFGIICAMIFRIHKGIEISDETFYAVTGLRIAQGNIPFKEMWESIANGYILLYPFFKIYYLINGSTGIQLAMRYAYLFFSSSACIPFFLLFRKKISWKASILISSCFVFYAAYFSYSLSYNNFNLCYSLLGIGFLLYGMEKDSYRCFGAAGISFALLAFSYPTHIVSCAVVAVVLPFMLIILKTENVKKKWTYFVAGGLMTAIVLAFILLGIAGYSNLRIAIHEILNGSIAPANADATVYEKFCLSIIEYLSGIITYKSVLILFLIIMSICILTNKKIIPLLVMLIYLLYVFYIMRISVGGLSMGHFSRFLSYLLLPLLLLGMKDSFVKMIYFLQVIPSFIIYLVTSFTTGGGANQASNVLILFALAVVEIYFYLTMCIFREEHKEIRGTIIGFVFTGMVVVSFILLFYSFVYRDSEVKQLTYRINRGPYKGLYTTKERGLYINDLYDKLQELKEPGKKYAIMFHHCYGYLMFDDMIPWTPNAWGIFDPSYEINNEDLFLHFYDIKGAPDIIYMLEDVEQFAYSFPADAEATCQQYNSKICKWIYSNYNLVVVNNEEGCAKIQKYVRAD